MAIHAFAVDYLPGAQRVLGDAVDFAVITLELEPDTFGNALAVSDAGKQFARGNPKYVAGLNGCEFARLVLSETCTPFTDREDVMFLEKSPKFWAGWALADYQWHSDYSFMEILNTVSLNDIICMYPAYHEMDIRQFADTMRERLKAAHPHTKLRMHRENCGMSQSELAHEADVPLRQIQLFEQRQRNINMTAAETLLNLSKALCCRMEDLLEKD